MQSETKMYLNGLLTEKQLITIIVAIIAIIVVASIAKKVVKLILTIGIVIAALVYFGVVSPDTLMSVEKVIEKQGTKVIEELAEASENIKITAKDKDMTIEIKPDKTDIWVDISSIDKMITEDDEITIIVDKENSYTVTDEHVIKLLKLFKK